MNNVNRFPFHITEKGSRIWEKNKNSNKDSRQLLMEYLDSLRAGGYYIQVKKEIVYLNNPQGYYRKFVVPAAAEEMGYWDTDEAHMVLAGKFLSSEYPDPSNPERMITVIRSTTTLEEQEFWVYIQKCRYLLEKDFGLVLPDPQRQIK